MMEAGRELDAKVAEALGWKWAHDKRQKQSLLMRPDIYAEFVSGVLQSPDFGQGDGGFPFSGELVPHFSTDITDAWQLIIHLRENDRTWLRELLNVKDDIWQCQFVRYTTNEEEFGVDRFRSGSVEGAPLAICLAFLKAKGVE